MKKCFSLLLCLLMLVQFAGCAENGTGVTTGTPAGIGPMNHGDKVSVIIESIGTLTNYME
jgi:hypothetical protein